MLKLKVCSVIVSYLITMSLYPCICSESDDVGQPISYYINLEASVDRKYHMEKSLNRWKMQHRRVRAYTPKELVVGKQMLNYSHCTIQDVPNLYAEREGYQGPPDSITAVRVVELCGRPRNLLKELAGVVGHLMAIWNSVYSTDKNPYALILEDDVEFGFKVDFNALAATAPKDWLVLQLLTSNGNRVSQLWEQYQSKKGKGDLWMARRIFGPHHMDFWCAGAYLIHKERMKPIMERIFHVHKNGVVDLRIIAGYHRPCFPMGCCHEHDWNPPKLPPCIFSPRGFGADDFIYALGPVYVLKVPVVGGAAVGNSSTIHQYEVKLHVDAFRIISGIIKKMHQGKAQVPRFLKLSS